MFLVIVIVHICLISHSRLHNCWLEVGSSCHQFHSRYPFKLKLYTKLACIPFVGYVEYPLNIFTSICDMIHYWWLLFPLPSSCGPQLSFSVITQTEFQNFTFPSFSLHVSVTSKYRGSPTFSALVLLCLIFPSVDTDRKHWLLSPDSGKLFSFSFRTQRKLVPGMWGHGTDLTKLGHLFFIVGYDQVPIVLLSDVTWLPSGCRLINKICLLPWDLHSP